ncbi:hypothetical protein [Mastigocoleus sp. MO_188.B34]|uniref:hypothetical protein n=1 Tax=Mastigocoleus sp. MO_188.B34 TaxID=3036635 RepID=UPI0026092803|nr:hypothetical protein [Mastigocoleus sp. MO_188.B34]MDJ0692844.1 hypothetical protein [Mastigocoleus sp. MO_188.B34]
MAKNVIITIGDGVGWEITHAAAIPKQINEGATGINLADFYAKGSGNGLSFQNLEGYAIATSGGTYIDGIKSNSDLIIFGDRTLAILNGVTDLDVNSSIVFA